MEIDSMDESIYMGPKDPHVSVIMKGKRTKRPRQPSPASAVFTASSCSSDAGGGGGRGGGRMHSKIRSSESLCSEISTTTEEDEDMANCLILLAQSGRRNSINTTIQIKNNVEKQEEGDDEMMKLDKYSVRKVKEMTIKTSSTIVGKAKIYVYECKTCNRCFPSFQALGGHRTSHKKQNDDDHHEEKGKKFPKISPSSLLSLELAKKNSHGSNIIIDNNNNNNSKAKIHECSICGAEFASGQALGGHMRRHRSPPARATTPASGSSHDQGGERPRNVMELDLNLPAPPEDGGHHQFRLSLFSSPALVDC